MNINPYLTFPGAAQEAMCFCEKALGGTLTEFHRFGAMPHRHGIQWMVDDHAPS